MNALVVPIDFDKASGATVRLRRVSVEEAPCLFTCPTPIEGRPRSIRPLGSGRW